MQQTLKIHMNINSKKDKNIYQIWHYEKAIILSYFCTLLIVSII